MSTDAFTDVDPHHPGTVVAIEPVRFTNSKEISLGDTVRWAKDLTSFCWIDLVLDPDILGEQAYQFLLIETRQNRLRSEQVYSAVKDRAMLYASMKAGVKGVIIELPFSSLAYARGYLQRVRAAQEDIIWKRGTYHLDPLEKVPVLVHHRFDEEMGLDALLGFQEEGLVAGCVDATPSGTLLEVYDKIEHPCFTLLRAAEEDQSWVAWNHEALPIVRMPSVATVLDYAVAGDLWLRYMGKEIEGEYQPDGEMKKAA